MIAIGPAPLRSEIRRYWEDQFSAEIQAAQEHLSKAEGAANEVRGRLAAEEERRTQIEQLIQEQQNIQGGCQERRRHYPERLESARLAVADAERALAAAEERASKAAEDEAYRRRRVDEIEDMRPYDTSDYEGRMEAYNRQMSNFDREILDLEKTYKEAQNAAAEDASKSSIADHLWLSLEDLKRTQRTLEVPHENTAYKQQLRQFEERLREAESNRAAAFVEMHDASEDLESARTVLSHDRRRLDELEAEPELDVKRETEAREAEAELLTELEGLQLAALPHEQNALRTETVAQTRLDKIRARCEAAIQESVDRLEQETRQSQLDQLALLTGERDTVAELWHHEVASERERIAAENVPELAGAKEQLDAKERELSRQKSGLRHRFGSTELSEKESNALANSFTPKDWEILKSGGELAYIRDRGFLELFLPVYFGGILGFAALAGLWRLIFGESQEGFSTGFFVLMIALFVGTGVYIGVKSTGWLFYRQRVSLAPGERDLRQVNDPGGKYWLYNQAVKHAHALSDLRATETEVDRLAETWSGLNDVAFAYAERMLPDTESAVPLLGGAELDADVADLSRTILMSAVGDGAWPHIDFELLQAHKQGATVHYNNVWDRWSANLRRRGLGVFVRKGED